jgi:hypothetical protein
MSSTGAAGRLGPAGTVRTARGPLLVVGAALVVALAAIAVGALPREASYPIDSPETALQRNLDTWDRGDADAAYAAFSPRARQLLPHPEFERSVHRSGMRPMQRAWVERVTRTDDRAFLRIMTESGGGGILGLGREREQITIRMVLLDGVWLIDQPMTRLNAW